MPGGVTSALINSASPRIDHADQHPEVFAVLANAADETQHFWLVFIDWNSPPLAGDRRLEGFCEGQSIYGTLEYRQCAPQNREN